uniref:Uncharacterized protein n=1 Tax=Ralstonia solanacearum TaxID=305 RepID=A0A0S4U5G5_RALSL|nr:exported protein of unknown function [Ralstonia solanacearum]CUV27494.1 exported protein of unknown function [Ralstonia solanacearum]CUV46380.1 exported protein of unknown function [Ralstonia solanacearum]
MRFDTSKQTPLMLACFASIGLNAKRSSLKVRGADAAALRARGARPAHSAGRARHWTGEGAGASGRRYRAT